VDRVNISLTFNSLLTVVNLLLGLEGEEVGTEVAVFMNREICRWISKLFGRKGARTVRGASFVP
jgi:hypothetical protein